MGKSENLREGIQSSTKIEIMGIKNGYGMHQQGVGTSYEWRIIHSNEADMKSLTSMKDI